MGAFSRKEVIVEMGGRQYVCCPPTVETVDRALTLLAEHVWALASGFHEHGFAEFADPDVVISVLFNGPRGALVLETCVTTPGARISDVLAHDLDAQRALAGTVARLCDLRRVVRSLNLDRHFGPAERAQVAEPAAEGADDEPSALETAVALLGRLYGVPPMDVMQWPYEALLTCTELLTREADQKQPPALDTAAGIPWVARVRPAAEA